MSDWLNIMTIEIETPNNDQCQQKIKHTFSVYEFFTNLSSSSTSSSSGLQPNLIWFFHHISCPNGERFRRSVCSRATSLSPPSPPASLSQFLSLASVVSRADLRSVVPLVNLPSDVSFKLLFSYFPEYFFINDGAKMVKTTSSLNHYGNSDCKFNDLQDLTM